MKISVIIPMYNESTIIADTAKTLCAAMSEAFTDYEILFSNDGSTDGCDRLLKELDLPCVRVTGYEQNRGKGCAVRTAMLEATGDILLFTDADLAYGTDVICRAAEWLEKHPEKGMLIGSRTLDAKGYAGYRAFRKIASKIYLKMLCLLGGFRLSDSQCGFKAFRANVAKQIFSRCQVDGFAFDFEVILLAQAYGVDILEMPVSIINHRESKVRVFRDSFRMLRDVRKIRKRIRKEQKSADRKASIS